MIDVLLDIATDMIITMISIMILFMETQLLIRRTRRGGTKREEEEFLCFYSPPTGTSIWYRIALYSSYRDDGMKSSEKYPMFIPERLPHRCNDGSQCRYCRSTGSLRTRRARHTSPSGWKGCP